MWPTKAHTSQEAPTSTSGSSSQAQQLGDKVAWTNAEIGMCYKELGKYEEALKYYLIIINSGELDNDIYKKTWVLSEIAYIYQNIDKYEEALEYFKKLEKIVVGDYQFYLDHAYCLIFVNHYTEAITKIEKALELHEDIYSISQLAFCYRNLGEYEKALRYYLKAKSLGREDAWINLEFGLCYRDLNEYEKALKYFLEAYEKEERYKTDTYLLSSIGKMYDLLGKYENGEEFLRKSYNLGERDRWINMELGECLTRLGKYEEAIEKLLEARKLYMAEGKAPYSEDLELAYCYAALGDKEKAKYHMDSSIEALGAYAESEEYLKKRFTEIKEMINSLK